MARMLVIARDNRFFHIIDAAKLADHRAWGPEHSFYTADGHVVQLVPGADGTPSLVPTGGAGDPAVPLQRLNSAVLHLAQRVESDQTIRSRAMIARQLRSVSGDLSTKLRLLDGMPIGSAVANKGTGLHNLIHRVFG